jgi:hypothetical protein
MSHDKQMFSAFGLGLTAFLVFMVITITKLEKKDREIDKFGAEVHAYMQKSLYEAYTLSHQLTAPYYAHSTISWEATVTRPIEADMWMIRSAMEADKIENESEFISRKTPIPTLTNLDSATQELWQFDHSWPRKMNLQEAKIQFSRLQADMEAALYNARNYQKPVD